MPAWWAWIFLVWCVVAILRHSASISPRAALAGEIAIASTVGVVLIVHYVS